MSKQAVNKLRHFIDLDDLFANNENEQILNWVNELAEKKESQQKYHKRRQMINSEFVKLAKQMLAEDEKERVEAGVDERLEK